MAIACSSLLFPILSPARYDLTAADYRTKEEENRLLHGRVAEWLQGLSQRPGFKPQLPTCVGGPPACTRLGDALALSSDGSRRCDF